LGAADAAGLRFIGVSLASRSLPTTVIGFWFFWVVRLYWCSDGRQTIFCVV
jgi:hypothetical protein